MKHYSSPGKGAGVTARAAAERREQFRSAIEAKLRDPESAWKSDRELAQLVGCSPWLVEGVRKRLGLTETARSARDRMRRDRAASRKKGELSCSSRAPRPVEERLRVGTKVYLARLLPVPCQCWRIAACLRVETSNTDDGRNRIRRAGPRGRPGKERR